MAHLLLRLCRAHHLGWPPSPANFSFLPKSLSDILAAAMEPRHLEDPTRFGALAATLFGLVGYAACLFLSLIKLRTEHNCSSFIEDLCGDRCSATLRDAASELLGLPITVYGAAVYLVACLIALRSSRSASASRARVPLLALAWFTFAVSVLYFSYAAIFLKTVCEYCGLLYLTSIGMLLGASLLNGSRPLRSLRGLLEVRVWVMAGLTILGIVTSLAVHANLYRRLAAGVGEEACEQTDVLALPETSLRVPATREPAVVVAAFVDLACPHCRMSVEFWRKYQAARSNVIELRLYHFPRDCYGRTEDHACDAARVVECLAPQLGGRQLEFMDALFALQDGPSPLFDGPKLNAVAAEFGITGAEACRNQGATVQAHVEFAQNAGLQVRPSALLIRMYNGAPTTAITVQGSTKNEVFLDQKIHELLASAEL